MKKILKFWPFFVFVAACVIYYWKVFLKGYVPFPGDLLVGAYQPWLDSKWGFPAGVPVKNPLISDVFSQFYIWKSLISEGWRHLQIPLWNPYSYSGYPMLANFHSGVFYPLNIIHMLLGDVRGWSFLVMFPSFAAAVTMYFFLRQIKLNKIGAVIGAVIYSYCGFAISWAQFLTAAQAMVWIPLVLLFIEKYFLSKNVRHLYWLPLIFFLLITSGHFQIMVYVTILTIVYFFWKLIESKNGILILGAIIPGILSVGLAAFQLLPTIELTKFGLRLSDNTLSAHNYGLLPIKYLTTLLAPDYFGNPATGNFFGFFNYHETLIYCGVLAVFCFVLSLFFLKSNKYIRFFVVAAVLAILFAFDTPLGRTVYSFKVPGLSTSDAGRISVIFALSMAVLVGSVISNLDKISLKKILMAIGMVGLFYAVIYYLARFTNGVFISDINPSLTLIQRRAVTLRNLVLPGAFVAMYSLIFILSKKWKMMTGALLLLICMEMFRFGWKYIPFVPERIVYPETPITTFLEDKAKTEVFRIERENAEVLPPATWMQFRLMSPAGYDPMAREDYVSVYQEKLNDNHSGMLSRYSRLERYDATSLGYFNVKYLVVVKRDKLGVIPGDSINYRIDMKDWKRVSETAGTAVLENLKYQPRARFVDSRDGTVNIVSYKPNTVKISYSNGAGKILLLSDSWFPGWKAFVNNNEVTIEKCEGIFRCIKTTDQNGEVIFDYQPESFWLGMKISGVSLILTITALVILKRKKKRG